MLVTCDRKDEVKFWLEDDKVQKVGGERRLHFMSTIGERVVGFPSEGALRAGYQLGFPERIISQEPGSI